MFGSDIEHKLDLLIKKIDETNTHLKLLTAIQLTQFKLQTGIYPVEQIVSELMVDIKKHQH